MRAQLGGDMPADVAFPRSMRELLAIPPGWPFHLMCAVPAAALLWGASTPASTGWAFGGFAGTVVIAVLWMARLIAHGWVNGHGGRRFVIAPAGGLLVAALIVLGIPLQARWAFAHHAFDRVVEDLPAADDASDVPSSGRIGGYSISWVNRVKGGVLFELAEPCGLFDDAGFGWFPTGPDPAALENGSFENPEFSHIWGPWYTWCASW